jgi:hypothetical protein
MEINLMKDLLVCQIIDDLPVEAVERPDFYSWFNEPKVDAKLSDQEDPFIKYMLSCGVLPYLGKHLDPNKEVYFYGSHAGSDQDVMELFCSNKPIPYKEDPFLFYAASGEDWLEEDNVYDGVVLGSTTFSILQMVNSAQKHKQYLGTNYNPANTYEEDDEYYGDIDDFDEYEEDEDRY